MSYDAYLERCLAQRERDEMRAASQFEDATCPACKGDLGHAELCLWCYPDHYLEELLKSAMDKLSLHPDVRDGILKMSKKRKKFPAARKFNAMYLRLKRQVKNATN